jgi:hypothetical protein
VEKIHAALEGMPGVQFVDIGIATHPELFTQPSHYLNT